MSISSNCWYFLMASSSLCGDEFSTYFKIYDVRDIKNMLRRTSSSNCALHRLQHFYHSCIWSDMCVESVCLKWVRSSKHKPWRTGSWKNARKVLSRELKFPCDAEGWSMYHFTVGPVKVCWNSHSQIVSYVILLDEHHRWKFMTWFLASSPYFPLNFLMSEGSLVGMAGQF